MRNLVRVGMLVPFVFGASAFAEEGAVNGELAASLQEATLEHIQATQELEGGDYVVYDVAANDVKSLKFQKMGNEVVRNDEHFLITALFTDGNGTSYHVDFQVTGRDGELLVHQTGVLKAAGKKR